MADIDFKEMIKSKHPTQGVVLQEPPYALEAEQSLVGGLMLDNAAWDLVVSKVCESDFYRHEHRILFGVMRELTKRNQPFDVITVLEALKSKNELDPAGGEAYLFELANNTPSAANVVAYAEIVREKSVLRQLIGVSEEIAEAAYHPQGRVVHELLDLAETKIFAIAEQTGSDAEGPQSINQILAHTLEKLDTLFHSKEAITGIETGFTDFDKLTSGLQRSDLIILAGRPSMGKTVLGVNIAEHVVMNQKNPLPTLMFSMEMPGQSIATRMISSLSRVALHRLRTGALSEADWTRVVSAVGMLSAAPFFVDDSPSLSPAEVRARARRLVKSHGPLGLIVIDYLQLMKVPGFRVENRVLEISEISRSLKALAKELNVVVIALSQLNRSLEQRADKRPVMSDLRESGAIEQDADLIVFIYRDEVYNKDTPEKGIAEIIMAKHRNGPIGAVKLNFLGELTRFENLAYQGYQEIHYGAPHKTQD